MNNQAKVIVEGYAFNQETRDWTERVEYIAQSRIEAIRWMNFNRDWMKHLRIVEDNSNKDQ